jgi:hypothetical protein
MERVPPGSTVLMYGTDAFLLETRRLVLTSTGYLVSCVLSLSDLEHFLRFRHPHLVVLCHSLSPEAQEQACRIVRRTSPESRTLLLSTYDGTMPKDGAVVNCFEGPARLISAMAELTSRSAERA